MGTDRYFSFRFDVDSHRCVARGVPRLLELGERVDARFTFFVNMGRAVSSGRFVDLLLRRRSNEPSAAKFSSLKKLGALDYLRVALLNPRVGAAHPDIVREMERAGHEVGLHGGRNHADWRKWGALWSEAVIREEVEWGLRAMESAGVSRPVGFASPGWRGSRKLNTVLEELGFEYVADSHGVGLEHIGPWREGSSIFQVPTGVVAEPGGVGYVEHMKARGCCDEEILKDFRSRLATARRCAVVYDHPFFAGTLAVETVEAMVMAARDLGFQVVTLQQLAELARRAREHRLPVPGHGGSEVHSPSAADRAGA